MEPTGVTSLVPLANVDREALALGTHPESLALVSRARAEIASGLAISLEKMRKRVLPRRKASNPRLQRPAALPEGRRLAFDLWAAWRGSGGTLRPNPTRSPGSAPSSWSRPTG